MAACAKHFVAYGASEGGKDYNSTFVPERVLRNVYLPPFKAAVDAGCATFMTSFNDNDGVPGTANKFVLKDILRDEWKFDGMVVTDWASAAEMINHGFCADGKDAAEKSVNAGVDMDMVSETFIKNLKRSLEENVVSMQAIDNAVRNILRLKFCMGLFDNPYIATPQRVKYAEEHLKDAITVEALSRVAAMSPRNFARSFKKFSGTSPAAWLRLLRLRKAEELLETTDLPIASISEITGFQSPVTFRQAFQAAKTVSPQSYRNTFRTEETRSGIGK